MQDQDLATGHEEQEPGILTAHRAPATLRFPAGLLGTAGPIAAHARDCLAAARADRDWFRRAVVRLEAAGERIVPLSVRLA